MHATLRHCLCSFNLANGDFLQTFEFCTCMPLYFVQWSTPLILLEPPSNWCVATTIRLFGWRHWTGCSVRYLTLNITFKLLEFGWREYQWFSCDNRVTRLDNVHASTAGMSQLGKPFPVHRGPSQFSVWLIKARLHSWIIEIISHLLVSHMSSRWRLPNCVSVLHRQLYFMKWSTCTTTWDSTAAMQNPTVKVFLVHLGPSNIPLWLKHAKLQIIIRNNQNFT